MSRQATGSDQPSINTLLVLPWDQERGGVTSVAENLTKYLLDQGHRVLFFHPGRSPILKTRTTKLGFRGAHLRLGVPFATLRSILAFPLFPIVLLQLIWFLRRHRIQIVNLHYPMDDFFCFAVCRRLLPIRLVTSVHGRDAFYKERPKDKYSRAFKFILRSSDLIVLPSDTYRRKLLEAFPDVQDKTIFIHNCIDPAQFRHAEDRQNRNGPDRYILCIASLHEYKGIDILLEAAEPLLTRHGSLSLVVAGDGPLREKLEGLASSLGIRNRVQFLGQKGAADILRLLHGCEVFVLPSREEPFGIVLIEAMACRKPVVANKVGGIPEIIEHEKSGILVEPENPVALAAALQRLLTNGELRKSLADNGYAKVMERFCMNHTGAAYEAAFASLLETSRSSPHSPSEISAAG